MTNEREIDRAIDAAAGAMMTREPSRALAYAVMSRVRDGRAAAPRRFVWVLAAASAVVFGAIATTLMSETRTTVPSLPRAAQLIVGQHSTPPDASVALLTEAPPHRHTIHARRVATRAPLPRTDVSPIEPIHTHPIVLSSLDVPQLQRETTVIDALNVEPLTIEPLATSND